MPLDVSIIVPSYSSSHTLPTTLQALAVQTFPSDRFEVIVVDDCSTDDTQTIVEKWESKVPFCLQYIQRPFNGGPGASRNSGLKVAQGEVIGFVDSDVEAAPNWIELDKGLLLPLCTEP